MEIDVRLLTCVSEPALYQDLVRLAAVDESLPGGPAVLPLCI